MIRFLKTLTKSLLGLTLLLLVVYLLGPRPESVQIDPNPTQLDLSLIELDEYIRKKEEKTPSILPDAHAQIVWADSNRQQTPYSIVYLHGFSATHWEASELHRYLSKRYGANLYLSRLAKHGSTDLEAWADLGPKDLINSAKEALAVGRILGEKVILMGCSTGVTYGLYLATADEAIEGILAYSPNIAMYDSKAWLLSGPWGLQIARFFTGSKYRSYEASEDVQKYWTTKYRIEGLIALQQLIDATMTQETFAQVKQPLFLGYYYKNEAEQDKTVSVSRMLEMFEQLGTPKDQKRKKVFAKAGTHVITSPFHNSPEELEKVEEASVRFLEEVLKLNPVSNATDTLDNGLQ